MENTCNFKQCKFGKKHFKKADECFNYRETWWTPADGSTPVLLKDCAPVRTMIMVQNFTNQQIGLQQAMEQQRNEARKIMDFAEGIIDCVRAKMIEDKNKKLIEIG